MNIVQNYAQAAGKAYRSMWQHDRFVTGVLTAPVVASTGLVLTGHFDAAAVGLGAAGLLAGPILMKIPEYLKYETK